MSIVRRLLIPLIALILAAPGLTAQSGPDDRIPEGFYEFVPEESDEIDSRIDRAVSHMNFLIRGIAKRRLRGANRPIEYVDLRYEEDSVWISLGDDEPWIVSRHDGEFGPFTRPDGEVVELKTELREGVIDQYFRADDGDKRMTYTLRDDGMLALESTIYSDRLEEPFRYTWVFRPVPR